MYENRTDDTTFIQLRTVGKEDSSCGLATAWITGQLIRLLQENPNASINDIITKIGPNGTNRDSLIKFTKDSADVLSALISEDRDTQQALAEGKRFAEQLFVAQEAARREEIEAAGRKYVTMTIPHGNLLIEIFKHFNLLSENSEKLAIFIDGLKESQIDESITVYHNNSIATFTSSRIFLNKTYLLLKDKIKENGDFIIFPFSGEFSDSFSCWIVLCVRKIEGKIQFIVLDSANSTRYTEKDQMYFPGALYKRYTASPECIFCYENRTADEMVVLPCSGNSICQECLTNNFNAQKRSNPLSKNFECPFICGKYLPTAYSPSFNPRIKPSLTSTGIQAPEDIEVCKRDLMLRTPSTKESLKEALNIPNELNNIPNDIHSWLRTYWVGIQAPGSFASFVTLLNKAKSDSESFFREQERAINATIELITRITELIREKISNEIDQTIVLTYVHYIVFNGGTLQAIARWLTSTELRDEALKNETKRLLTEAKRISDTAPASTPAETLYREINALLAR